MGLAAKPHGNNVDRIAGGTLYPKGPSSKSRHLPKTLDTIPEIGTLQHVSVLLTLKGIAHMAAVEQRRHPASNLNRLFCSCFCLFNVKWV